MFRKILLPIDQSNKHRQALEIASDLAGASVGEVILLHVIEVIPGLAFEEERDFYARLEKAARHHLEQQGERLQHRHIPWRAEILYGNRVAEIVRFAREGEVDLIILTSPQIDPQNLAAGWGSLSYRVGILASCPVLLVK